MLKKLVWFTRKHWSEGLAMLVVPLLVGLGLSGVFETGSGLLHGSTGLGVGVFFFILLVEVAAFTIV